MKNSSEDSLGVNNHPYENSSEESLGVNNHHYENSSEESLRTKEKIMKYFFETREKILKIIKGISTGALIATSPMVNADPNNNNNYTDTDTNNTFESQQENEYNYDSNLTELFTCIGKNNIGEDIKEELKTYYEKLKLHYEKFSYFKGNKLKKEELEDVNNSIANLEKNLNGLFNEVLDGKLDINSYEEFLQTRRDLNYANARIFMDTGQKEQAKLAEQKADLLNIIIESLYLTKDLYNLLIKNQNKIPSNEISYISEALKQILETDARSTMNKICTPSSEGQTDHLNQDTIKISKKIDDLQTEITKILQDHRIDYSNKRINHTTEFIKTITQQQNKDIPEEDIKTTEKAFIDYLDGKARDNTRKIKGNEENPLEDLYKKETDQLIKALESIDINERREVIQIIESWYVKLANHTPWVNLGEVLARFTNNLYEYSSVPSILESGFKPNQIENVKNNLKNLDKVLNSGDEEKIEELGRKAISSINLAIPNIKKVLKKLNEEKEKYENNKETIRLFNIILIILTSISGIGTLYKMYKKRKKKLELSNEVSKNIGNGKNNDLDYINKNTKYFKKKYKALGKNRLIKTIHDAFNKKYESNTIDIKEIKQVLFPSMIQKIMNKIKE
jgi:hypothetical protein